MKSSGDIPYPLLKLALILLKNKEISSSILLPLRIPCAEKGTREALRSHLSSLPYCTPGQLADQTLMLSATQWIFFTQVDLCYFTTISQLLPSAPTTQGFVLFLFFEEVINNMEVCNFSHGTNQQEGQYQQPEGLSCYFAHRGQQQCYNIYETFVPKVQFISNSKARARLLPR